MWKPCKEKWGWKAGNHGIILTPMLGCHTVTRMAGVTVELLLLLLWGTTVFLLDLLNLWGQFKHQRWNKMTPETFEMNVSRHYLKICFQTTTEERLLWPVGGVNHKHLFTAEEAAVTQVLPNKTRNRLQTTALHLRICTDRSIHFEFLRVSFQNKSLNLWFGGGSQIHKIISL